MADVFLVPRSVLQTDQRSFIGGLPTIPISCSLPVCELCGNPLTFFFQIESHIPYLAIAVFACTSCASEDDLIPEMLDVPLRGAMVEDSFLQRYQNNFKILAFNPNEAVPRTDYAQRIEFSELEFADQYHEGCFGKLAGLPNWIAEYEAPCEANFDFLVQVFGGHEFAVTDHAPPQVAIDLRGNAVPSVEGYYELV